MTIDISCIFLTAARLRGSQNKFFIAYMIFSYDLADDRNSLSLVGKVTGDDFVIKNEVYVI